MIKSKSYFHIYIPLFPEIPYYMVLCPPKNVYVETNSNVMIVENWTFGR